MKGEDKKTRLVAAPSLVAPSKPQEFKIHAHIVLELDTVIEAESQEEAVQEALMECRHHGEVADWKARVE